MWLIIRHRKSDVGTLGPTPIISIKTIVSILRPHRPARQSSVFDAISDFVMRFKVRSSRIRNHPYSGRRKYSKLTSRVLRVPIKFTALDAHKCM